MTVSGYLPLRMLLTGRAVLSGRADPVRAVTADTIPGRALQGMFAAAIAGTDPDEVVRLAVRGDAVQFGPGLPLQVNEDLGVPVGTFVAPLSWHTDAHQMTFTGEPVVVDVLQDEPSAGTDRRLTQIRAVLGRDAEDESQVGPLRPAVAARWHQQRDRQSGRPTEATGGPFERVALTESQVFATHWKLTAATPADLKALVDEVLLILDEAATRGLLVLGTAARAGYGGAPQVHLMSVPAGLESDHDPRLTRRHSFLPEHESWPKGEIRDVVLSSPTLVVDPETGRVRPASLPDAVVAAYGGQEQVEAVQWWIEHARYGGYNSTWRSPVTEEWAAAAGSVVRLKALADIAPDALELCESKALGIRSAEGLGRHLLLEADSAPGSLALGWDIGAPHETRHLSDEDPGALHLSDEDPGALPEHDRAESVVLADGELYLDQNRTPIRVGLAVPKSAEGWTLPGPGALQHELFSTVAARELRAAARAETVGGPLPSAHLLARVAAILPTSDTLSEATAALSLLRRALTLPDSDEDTEVRFAAPARGALRLWRRHDANVNRLQWLIAAAPPTPGEAPRQGSDDWAKVVSDLAKSSAMTKVTLNCWSSQDVASTWAAQHHDRLVVIFLRSFLTVARRTAQEAS